MKLLDIAACVLVAGGALVGYLCFGLSCGGGQWYGAAAIAAIALGLFSAWQLKSASKGQFPCFASFGEASTHARHIVSSKSLLLGSFLPLQAPTDWRLFELASADRKLGVLVESTRAQIVFAVSAAVFVLFWVEPITTNTGKFTALLRGGAVNCAIALAVASLMLWGSATFSALAWMTSRSNK